MALYAKVAQSYTIPGEYLVIIQGEEKVLTFVVESDGEFDQATPDSISVLISDPLGGTVEKLDADVDRIGEAIDIQVFRITLSAEDTESLTPGLLRIELTIDSQKAVITHSVKIEEAL